MNNIVDIIYSKNETCPQISINGEKISRYMELADLIHNDIYLWAEKLFESMDDELCENYTVRLVGHPFQHAVLKALQSVSQHCSDIQFTAIAYKIPMEDKLDYASWLNVRYNMGIAQTSQIGFNSDTPDRFSAMLPCTQEPGDYYISEQAQLPENGAKLCVFLAEQLRCEKRQGVTILYLPAHLLSSFADYFKRYHQQLGFVAKVFTAANDLSMSQQDRLMMEAYSNEEYRIQVAALPQTMNTGERIELSYVYYPRQFADPQLRAGSNNPAVLFVAGNLLIAQAPGTAMVVLTDYLGGVHGTYQITVEYHNYVSDISIVLPATTLKINETLNFKCLISPNDAEDLHNVRYSISDTSVAAFSGQNEIYGIAAGRVKVTVAAQKISKSFYLTVLPKAKEVLLPESSLKLETNAEAHINCVVLPVNASPMPAVKWRSTNPEVVQVLETSGCNCKILTVNRGTAELVCYLEGTEIYKAMHIEVAKPSGCYVATAVYGSYDCPQVWILRRYRDQFLASRALGRAFIKTYYAISPTIVKLFGKTKWFNRLWRGVLDNKIRKLKACGYQDTPYND